MAVGNGNQTGQGLLDQQYREDQKQAEQVDFKMVTFSLAGKDYGIDIMKVKEIAKFDSYTFVPNTPPYVAGVYNLRGDIISVIDLRLMFALSTPELGEGEAASGLILRLETGLIGVVVDEIHKVIGINSDSIQPPHPLFADVNLRYLSGIVEHDEKLYIILDVERILGEEKTTETQADAPQTVASRPAAMEADAPQVVASQTAVAGPADSLGEVDLAKFIGQTIHTLRGFTVSDINAEWLDRRTGEWSSAHGGDAQLRTDEEADEFLSSFFSPYTGRFWEDDYLDEWRAVLPRELSGPINVWNPGCGEGYETYSLACLLRSLYPKELIKIWASDNDLLNVSTAPNLTFDVQSLAQFYHPFIVEGRIGSSFAQEIKDLILFEYSDVLNVNTVPPCDIVLVRDLVSFLGESDQNRLLSAIEEKCKDGAIVVCGANERFTGLTGFEDVSQKALRAYRRS